MPRLSTLFIRASLVYLALGFSLGGVLLLNKGVPLHPAVWRLLPAHIESLLIGWTVQLIMGMGFWILPRFAAPRVRGNETLAWGAFISLNGGLGIYLFAIFLPEGSWLELAGRVAEFSGVLLFALHAWPRVKGFGR